MDQTNGKLYLITREFPNHLSHIIVYWKVRVCVGSDAHQWLGLLTRVSRIYTSRAYWNPGSRWVRREDSITATFTGVRLYEKL